MKVSILSNINLDPLKNQLRKLGFDDVYMACYNQYMFELLQEDSDLNTHAPQVAFFHLDGDEWLHLSLSAGTLKYDESQVRNFLMQLEKYAETHPACHLILSGVVLTSLTVLTHLNRNSRLSVSKIQESINKKMENLARNHTNVHYLDFPGLVSQYGTNNLVDLKFWYLGRIKYTQTAFIQLARLLHSQINAINGRSRKVLILDLDNTLWGGVVGEDGLQGIVLSEEGPGKVYRDFQQLLQQLKATGVLLALCSKNNESDAWEVLDKHPMMVLHRNDFVAHRINWNNKAENIRSIANELDLGLDSFVFIDDNPVEREQIRQFLPEVAVPEFPNVIELLNKWFVNEVVYTYFPKIALTKEDVQKTRQYQHNLARKSLSNTLDLGAYIQSLNIRLTLFKDDTKFLARIAQLTQKTNQFNLTTRRYSESDIDLFLTDPNHHVYAVDYTDRYGKEGIIAVAITKRTEKVIYLDTFLMSCRVIGRKVEHHILALILDDLRAETTNLQIKADYLPTAKNTLVRTFFTQCGFDEQKGNQLPIETLMSNLNPYLQ